jgi:hypothetical protein
MLSLAKESKPMTVVAMFRWECGSHGDVTSVFVCDPDVLETCYGAYLNFGDVFGDDVDICGVLEAEDITILTTDADAVAKVRAAYGETVVGRNPLLFLQGADSCFSDAY